MSLHIMWQQLIFSISTHSSPLMIAIYILYEITIVVFILYDFCIVIFIFSDFIWYKSNHANIYKGGRWSKDDQFHYVEIVDRTRTLFNIFTELAISLQYIHYTWRVVLDGEVIFILTSSLPPLQQPTFNMFFTLSVIRTKSCLSWRRQAKN